MLNIFKVSLIFISLSMTIYISTNLHTPKKAINVGTIINIDFPYESALLPVYPIIPHITRGNMNSHIVLASWRLLIMKFFTISAFN
jgi:hypothetical protein